MSLDTNDYSYLDLLFPGQSTDPIVLVAEAEAFKVKCEADSKAHQEAVKRVKEHYVANRCPKCAGEGYLPQFSHRKGGECYTCSGTGVFLRD